MDFDYNLIYQGSEKEKFIMVFEKIIALKNLKDIKLNLMNISNNYFDDMNNSLKAKIC